MLKDPVTKAFELLLKDIYEKAKDGLNKKFIRIEAYKVIDNIKNQDNNIKFVKTLWQIDKPVDLNEFYCDSHIESQGKRFSVSNLSEIDSVNNVVLEGIAGQGKSIFLRYLYSMELIRGNFIPIFIELRRIEGVTTLKSMIYNNLTTLGFEVSDEIFKFLCSYSKVFLLLDGFDEVKPEKCQTLLNEIDELSNIENIKILISTRPGTGVEYLSKFVLWRLSNVKGNEYKFIINKLLTNETLAKQLINKVDQNMHGVKDLLITPLLITLLIISYKRTQEVPRQLSDFYDSLFDNLLKRHDGSKPGFTRFRRCSFDDFEYRRIFEAICLLTKKADNIQFTYPFIYECCEEALNLFGHKEKPQNLIDDISEITCLLLKDGTDYRYIHKSVQEYYAACFIKNFDEAAIIEFYSELLKDKQLNLKQELYFLSEVDRFRYIKHFHLPLLCKLFGTSIDDIDKIEDINPKTETDKIIRIIEHFVLNVEFEKNGYFYHLKFRDKNRMNPYFEYLLLYENLNYYMGMIESLNGIKFNRESSNTKCQPLTSVTTSKIDETSFKQAIKELLEKFYLTDDIRKIAMGIYNSLYNSAIVYKKYLLSEETNRNNRHNVIKKVFLIDNKNKH